VRNKKRTELGIKDEFVVGHVGRLSYQKNHKFLIKIFNELLKSEPNSLLILVGVGEKEEEIKKQVKELGIDSKVKFLGNRSDVNELYQAMDVFVMPSFFEGVPVVGIEAQFSDVPCVFSDKVPDEVKFNSKTKFVSLEATLNEWVNTVKESKKMERNSKNGDMENSRYDINVAYSILENYYMNIVNKKGL
jgi:glycosyltransferase involved in cell wall biosynthesis